MKHIHTFESFLNEDAKSNISASDLGKITDVLNQVKDRFHSRNKVYWQTLFDPQQTHAFYGVSTDQVDEMKAKLTELGANKFRIVKNGNNPIICFNASKMAK